MSNRGLLIVLAVLLLGIFAVALGNIGPDRDDRIAGEVGSVSETIDNDTARPAVGD